MKTFYRVTSQFFDSGKPTAFVDTVRASQKPENTYHESTMCDVYEDYFDTMEEAHSFKSETENA